MNEQREIIYAERKRVLYGENLRDSIISMIEGIVDRAVDSHMNDEQLPEEWDMNAFSETLSAVIPVGKVNIKDDAMQQMTKEKLAESLKKLAVQMYELKEKEIGQGQPVHPLVRRQRLTALQPSRAVHRPIVMENAHPVGGEFGIQLDEFIPRITGGAEGGHGVLGCIARVAAMGGDCDFIAVG